MTSDSTTNGGIKKYGQVDETKWSKMSKNVTLFDVRNRFLRKICQPSSSSANRWIAASQGVQNNHTCIAAVTLVSHVDTTVQMIYFMRENTEICELQNRLK